MNVRELNPQQLGELKVEYYCKHCDENVSMSELAMIDDLVSDDEVFEEYGGISFTADDFWSDSDD